MDGAGRDEQGFAGLQRARQHVGHLRARMRVAPERSARRERDAYLDEFAAGNFQVVSADVGARDAGLLRERCGREKRSGEKHDPDVFHGKPRRMDTEGKRANALALAMGMGSAFSASSPAGIRGTPMHIQERLLASPRRRFYVACLGAVALGYVTTIATPNIAR